MRKYVQLTTIIATLGLFILVGCNKTTTTPNNNNNNNTPTACNGKTLCFKFDGTAESYDATWRVISVPPAADRNRIYWEGSNGDNIEIDIYANATGTYNIKDGNPYAAGDAAFQYYKPSAGKILYGKSGTITITEINTTNNTISGNFTVTAGDGTNSHQITEGNFVNVPK